MLRNWFIAGLCFALCACGSKEASEQRNAQTLSAETSEGIVPANPGAEAEEKAHCNIDISLERLPDACAGNGQYRAVFVNGSKSGYAVSGRLQKGDTVESCDFSSLEMKRGEMSLTSTTLVNVVESTDGTPLRWQTRVEGTGMNKASCGVIKDDVAYIRTVVAGNDNYTQIPWEPGTLMQEGVRLLMKKQPMVAGTKLQARAFDVESARVVTLDWEIKGAGDVDLLGKVTRGIRIDTTLIHDSSRIETQEWLTSDFDTLKSTTYVMGMKFEEILCEKAYALQNNNPSEIFTDSFIDSPRKLPRTWLSRGITYEILPEKGKEIEFPEYNEQKMSRATGSKAIYVEVMPAPMPKGGQMPYSGEKEEMAEYLSANAWIQSAHPEIVALAQKAVGDETSPGKAARKIEKFVFKYISNRSLSVGFASALEVSRSRQGDCTEFALLTAAMCRAAGIPSRVVFGVVYMAKNFEGHSHFFGGHAWTQVFVKDGWYSLDAALGKFDAGHIAIDFNNGDPSNFFKLVTTIGYFDIIDAKKR